MHPVCAQVHPLGRRARRPAPAPEREGKGGPAFPPCAFQPQLRSASPAQQRPLPRAGAARTGEELGPKGRSGLQLPLSAAPTSAQETQPPGSRLASTGRQGHRARRAEGGPGPCGPAEGGRRVRPRAVGASADSLPPALGRGRGSAHARPAREGPPRRRQTSQSLGKKAAAADEEEGTDARRRGRGKAPPPPPTARRRTGGLAQAHFCSLALCSPGFPGGLMVTCQAPAREKTELRAPGGESLSLAGEPALSAAAGA